MILFRIYVMRAQDKIKQYYCCFLGAHHRTLCLILFNYAIQGKFITFFAIRDSYDIGFRVQFNAEFPRQVMNFPIV